MFPFTYAAIFSVILSFSIARIRILRKGIQPLQKNTAGILLYIDIENESYMQPYSLSTDKERCCLKIDIDQYDCDSPAFYGGNWLVQPKERKKLVFVYPTIFPHDKVGTCNLILFTRCGTSKEITPRHVQIAFDTRIFGRHSKEAKSKLFKNYVSIAKARRCLSMDDDSLHKCSPVNCDLKYNGNRSFFDSKTRRCVPATTCLRDVTKDFPDVIYIPSGNVCRYLGNPISLEDLYQINVSENIFRPPRVKKHANEVELRCNCSTISQYVHYWIDLVVGKFSSEKVYANCSSEAKIAAMAVFALIFTACWQLGLCVVALVLLLKLREFWMMTITSRKAPASVFYYFKSFFKRQDPKEETVLLVDKTKKEGSSKVWESVSDLCERMGKEVGRSKRYRVDAVGSQVDLSETRTSRQENER